MWGRGEDEKFIKVLKRAREFLHNNLSGIPNQCFVDGFRAALDGKCTFTAVRERRVQTLEYSPAAAVAYTIGQYTTTTRKSTRHWDYASPVIIIPIQT